MSDNLFIFLSKQSASYTCQVSGPGLKSATVNHPTHVLVELRDSSGRPCSQRQKVTAELIFVPQETDIRRTRISRTTNLVIDVVSPSQYKVSYTAVSRSQRELHVQINDKEINGSPFTINMYPDPTRLGCPVRVVIGLDKPYGIAYNSRGEMIVSEYGGNRVSIFDNKKQKVRTFGSHGDKPYQMICPKGIAVDDMGNIYVSSQHKLQKFTSSGELIKCVGGEGGKEGEFDDPRGVTLYDNQVYVCDRNNHRIQVFDLDLNFVRSIGSHGTREFNAPLDIKIDTSGNTYVADFCGVQVLDSSGHFIRAFGIEREQKQRAFSALHIADTYVYISDIQDRSIRVYETSGQFINSFGSDEEGKSLNPYCITSYVDGFIHVCDYSNDRILMF